MYSSFYDKIAATLILSIECLYLTMQGVRSITGLVLDLFYI